MRILIAEHDLPLASFLSKGLTAENYAVDVVQNDGEAARLTAKNHYHLMIFDLDLPHGQGFQLIHKIREIKPTLPILFLSEMMGEGSRPPGIDDCLAKPFSFTELSARVRAMIRRGQPQIQPKLCVADLEIHRPGQVAKRGNRRIKLTPREFSLLEYLMLNSGQTVTRAMIIEHVWKLNLETITNVVDVYVNYLRRKIDDGCELKLIRTIRGVGYRVGSENAHGW